MALDFVLDDRPVPVDDIDHMISPDDKRESRGPGDPGWRPRAPRANLVHVATCRFADEPTSVEVISLNISQSGMLVRTPVMHPVGSQLEFRFTLENGLELIAGTGTVVRQASDVGGHPIIGIAFADIDPARRRILARVIELNSEAAAAAV